MTKPRIGKLFTPDPQGLLRDIVKGLSSAEGREKFAKVMKQDYTAAIFGNPLFGALDGKQRERALLAKTPEEDLAAIRLKGEGGPFAGMPCAEMSKDQKGVVEELLRAILAPYRASDVAEAMKVVQDSGGVDRLHLFFYSDEDLGNDQVWDNWMLEGPRTAWSFRGHPHVPTWVNVGTKI